MFETGLSDFHFMTLTVMKFFLKKLKPRIINNRSYKNFSNEKFKNCLLDELRKEYYVNNKKGFEKFCNISLNVLNKQAPREKKIARGNQMLFYQFYLENMSRKKL